MADFTPYGYTPANEAKALGRFNQYWIQPEPYQRYTGDWGQYQNAYYDFAKTNIDLAKSDAYQKFMDRQRRLGTGDSPTSDVLWQTRMEPEYLAKYLQASDASQLARGQMEMSDLSQYNAAMQSRANTESNALLNYLQQQRINDQNQWSINTGAGFQNRALSMAQSANDTDWGQLIGKLLGAAPAAALNIAGAGNLAGLWGGSTAALDVGSAATVGNAYSGVADAFSFFM